jgi:hypothetical protein
VARLAELLDELDDLDDARDDVCHVPDRAHRRRRVRRRGPGGGSTFRRLTARRASIEARVSAWIGRFDLERAVAAEPTVAAAATSCAARRSTRGTNWAKTPRTWRPPSPRPAAAPGPSCATTWPVAPPCASTLPGVLEPEQAGLARLRVLQGDPAARCAPPPFEAEGELLETHAVAFAAAMNGVKGEVATLSERRGWAVAAAPGAAPNGIGPAALDALQAAVRAAFPTFRRYLRAKARFLGLDRLAWYDLLAPVHTGPERTFDWPEASDFVIRHFARFSPALEALARRASDEGWIDVPPRTGKRNGAFCMGSGGVAESRILLNFGGSLDDVFTLAHELGHAFHNDAAFRAGRRPLQTRTPMTLAETASIFCETLITNALLDEADDATRLAVLEQDLRSGAQLVLDIDSRFRFEAELFTRRRTRAVGRGARRHHAGGPGGHVRRRARPRGCATRGSGPRRSTTTPPSAPSTTSRTPSATCSGSACTRATWRNRRASPPATRRCWRTRAWTTSPTSGARSGSTSRLTSFWHDALALAAERVEAYERLVDASATR